MFAFFRTMKLQAAVAIAGAFLLGAPSDRQRANHRRRPLPGRQGGVHHRGWRRDRNFDVQRQDLPAARGRLERRDDRRGASRPCWDRFKSPRSNRYRRLIFGRRCGRRDCGRRKVNTVAECQRRRSEPARQAGRLRSLSRRGWRYNYDAVNAAPERARANRSGSLTKKPGKAETFQRSKLDAGSPGRQKTKTGRVRAIVLKARQLGVGTYVAARFYHRTMNHPGLRTNITVHEKRASTNLFQLVKRFHEHMPEELRPSVGASNAEELIFDKIDSGYLVSVATGEGTGHSSTSQNLHASEAAF